jgi:hypothetical protein
MRVFPARSYRSRRRLKLAPAVISGTIPFVKSRARVLATIGFAAVLACADLTEILSLQQSLAHEFGTSAISVNLHGSAYLSVIFSNSPIAALTDSAQAAFARRVAEYVRDHYSHYERLQSIQVGFASERGGFGVRVTSTRVPYQFTPAELGPPRRAKQGAASKEAALPVGGGHDAGETP